MPLVRTVTTVQTFITHPPHPSSVLNLPNPLPSPAAPQHLVFISRKLFRLPTMIGFINSMPKSRAFALSFGASMATTTFFYSWLMSTGSYEFFKSDETSVMCLGFSICEKTENAREWSRSRVPHTTHRSKNKRTARY